MWGHKQKRLVEHNLCSSSSGSTDSTKHSALWNILMSRYAWGHMSASEVQQIALGAVQSGADRPDLHELAALGAYGNQLGNAQRDLARNVFSDVLTPNAFHLKTPLLGADGIKTRDYEVMLPHDWIAALASRDLLDKLMGSSQRNEFWEQQDFINNPCKKKAEAEDEKEEAAEEE